VAFSAEAADKPIVVAAVNLKPEAPKVRPASVSVTTSEQTTRETSIPEGNLEKFGSVGLPQLEQLEAPKVRLALVSVRVTRETSIPEGSLEKFSSVGLPQ